MALEDGQKLVRYFEKEQRYYIDNTIKMLCTSEELDIIN